MQFTYQGEVFEYDANRLPLKDALIVKRHTGMGAGPFMAGLRNVDPESLKAVVFLALRHAGRQVMWDDVDFDLLELAGSIRTDPVPDAPQEPLDPTSNGTSPNAGQTPQPVAASTWPTSPTI